MDAHSRMVQEVSALALQRPRTRYHLPEWLRMPPARPGEIHVCCYRRELTEISQDATGLSGGGSRSLLHEAAKRVPARSKREAPPPQGGGISGSSLLLLVRVTSWIVFKLEDQAIHEVTRKNTN